MRRNTGRPRRTPPAQPIPRPENTPAEVILDVLAGTWEPEPVPQPFRNPGRRFKSYCPACDLVHRGAMTCHLCGADTRQMGADWRPGRAGTRTRIWDPRVSWRRPRSYVPDVVRQLGVKGLPPPRPYWGSAPDPVAKAITDRGRRQRARRRRNRR